jgi:hypothetical protein
MSLNQVSILSENKLGSLPGYVSSGEHKTGVVVIQEVKKCLFILNFKRRNFIKMIAYKNFILSGGASPIKLRT